METHLLLDYIELKENKEYDKAKELLDYLDSKFIFIFQTIERFEIRYIYSYDYFHAKIYHYSKDVVEKLNLNVYDESRVEKIERIHNIKFKNEREYLMFMEKDNNNSVKKFEAWLYSATKSGEIARSKRARGIETW